MADWAVDRRQIWLTQGQIGSFFRFEGLNYDFCDHYLHNDQFLYLQGLLIFHQARLTVSTLAMGWLGGAVGGGFGLVLHLWAVGGPPQGKILMFERLVGGWIWVEC